MLKRYGIKAAVVVRGFIIAACGSRASFYHRLCINILKAYALGHAEYANSTHWHPNVTIYCRQRSMCCSSILRLLEEVSNFVDFSTLLGPHTADVRAVKLSSSTQG